MVKEGLFVRFILFSKFPQGSLSDKSSRYKFYKKVYVLNVFWRMYCEPMIYCRFI